MVRAVSRAPSTGRAPSVSQIRKDRKKPYKVQMEQVVAKKRKLKTKDIHGTVTPLKGFTFLPVGHADLAEHCKELSRKRGVEVALVSAGAKSLFARDPQSLSHHVHRVGYHFRTDIFDEACKWLGYKFVNNKLVRQPGGPLTFESQVIGVRPKVDLLDPNDRSEEQSIRVKKYIKELFPRIPDEDLEEIYVRAWQKGANTVGNAVDMSLSRQVQLATIARIRHTYTRYDQLLREVSWPEARRQVEHVSLAKLVEWRGEHDNDPEELEEVLRETIVIDEDDDSADEGGNEADGESDSDIEIVQQTIAPKDLQVDPNETKWRGGQFQHVGNTLPAAMRARWQNARNGGPPSHTQVGSASGTVSVPLDRLGQAPRRIVENGVTYTRISPGPEAILAQRPMSRAPGLMSHYTMQSRSQPYGPSPHCGARNTIDLTTAPRYFVQSHPQPHGQAPHHGTTQTIDLTTPPRHQAQPGRVLRYGEPQMIDLVTPPKTHPYYGAPVERAPLLHGRPAEVRTLPQTRVSHPESHRLLVATSDIPLPSREIPPPEHVGQRSDAAPAPRVDVYRAPPNPVYRQPVFGQTAFTPSHDVYRAPPTPVQYQPVFGEPAFPQMRSQHPVRYPPAGAVHPPSHGAPAAIQHLSPQHRAMSARPQSLSNGGRPLPQPHFPGLDQPRQHLSNR